jgi:ABC-2 type transport system ATP-binding protein
MGYLPENVPLYGDMRVSEMLAFAAHAKGIPAAERSQAAARAMAETGVDVVSGRLIRQLSKGFKQRVGLAQALIGDPEVLVLDEPTVGLDPRQIADIRLLIKSLAGRRTIVLSTHILPEVSAVCTKVVIINQGRILEQDTPQNLAKKLSKSSKVMVQSSGPESAVMQAIGALAQVKKVSVMETLGADEARYLVVCDKDADLRPAIAQAVVKKGWELRELRNVGLELEDVFLRLVTREGSGDEEAA